MEQEAKQGPSVEYPSLVTRVQSNAIDGILILIVMFAFAGIAGDNETIPGWGKAFLFLSFWFLYDPICTRYAATLGNYIMGIRVRKVDDYTQKISLKNAFVRVFVKGLLGGWSSISIHFNPRRRALHDLAAKSIMLEVEQPKKRKL
jgi:uncharacterized RDD family membrane protein YckC